MGFEIRSSRAGDLDAIESIENAAFSGDKLSRRSLRRLIKSPSAIIFVAEEGAHVAGYVMALSRRNCRILRLYSIAVDPRFSGRGVAFSLLCTIEREACEQGCCAVRLEVREDNAAAIRLYERAGYRQFGQYNAYYQDGMGALRFEKAVCMTNKESGPK